jgi:hypothetical protein
MAGMTGDQLLDKNSKFHDDLSVILSQVTDLFSIITHQPCRAAIKAFQPIKESRNDGIENFYVFTLARDESSEASHQHADRRRRDSKYDTLDKNPHLLSLFSDKVDSEDWECFNDVPKLICQGKYASSTLLWKMMVSHSTGSGMASHTLPYKAALVALVRRDNDSVIAFLGIDSPAPTPFRPNEDGPLLAAIAGYIGPLLTDAYSAFGPQDFPTPRAKGPHLPPEDE